MKKISTQSSLKKYIYALDIGSSCIRIISGIVKNNNEIIICGMMQCQSIGIVQGSVYDISSLTEQIAYLIEEFQCKYGVIVEHLIIGVSGSYIISENVHGMKIIQKGIIDSQDRNLSIKNAIAGCTNFNESEFSIIHAFPQSYQTETLKNVINPVGLCARRLDVDLHIIGCTHMYKNVIDQSIKMINPDIEVKSIVYVGNASSSVVLTESEKEIGVIHVDIGANSTSVTVYEDNRQLMSFGIEYAGNYITKYISQTLSVSLRLAEVLKCKYGVASSKLLSKDKMNTVVSVSSGLNIEFPYVETINIERRILSDLINHALNKIVECIFMKIEKKGSRAFKSLDIGAGIVLTGGSANLSGIDRAISIFLSDYNKNEEPFIYCYPKVRVGSPRAIELLDKNTTKEYVYPPDKACIIGLLRASSFETVEQYTRVKRNKVYFSDKC